MLTVACVKWGDRYSSVWVERLRSMVARHLSIQHRFVCLTDNPVDGIDCRSLEPGLPTWWSKVSLFKPGQFDDWVFYLDLDTVVTASLDPIIAAANDSAKLWMRDDFSYSLRNPRKDLDPDMIRLLGGRGCCNSSVMLWHGDAIRIAWNSFKPEVMKTLHGDQNFLSALLWPDRIGFLPDALVGSYKYGELRGEKIAPVMVFHGRPKMDDLPRANPLRKIWEEAA